MSNLNATNYNYSGIYYFSEFEDILSKITLCYKDMITSNYEFLNNENDIRDCLYSNYLNNDDILKQIQLDKYLFDKETNEDFGNGRVDIRICSQQIFENKKAYFIIECKRVDNININGTSGLNGEYVVNGMNRFIETDKYSSYYKTNALMGFVVSQLDVDSNMIAINNILKKLLCGSCTQEIQKENFIPNFPYHYSSCHTREDGCDIKLYHLMYDVSSKIV